MYQAYYSLSTDPFRLTPDQSFRFVHKGYGQVFARLMQALVQGAGVAVLTGRPGSGKTLLCNELLVRFADGRARCVQVTAAQRDGTELMHAVAAEFGLTGEPAGGQEPLRRLRDFLQRPDGEQHCLLAIDEVRDGAAEAVAQLAELTRLRTRDSHPVLQILLAGSPDLARRLGDIGITCELAGLDQQETGLYIAHRLWCAGWQGDPRFSAAAVDAIHALTRGNPRDINLVCGRLLLLGASEGRHELGVAEVTEVAAELREEMVLDRDCLARLFPSAPAPDPSPRREAAGEAKPMPSAHAGQVGSDVAGHAVRRADPRARRAKRRRSIARYAAAGSLLTAVLAVAIHQGGFATFGEWSLPSRAARATSPVGDRATTPEPEAVGGEAVRSPTIRIEVPATVAAPDAAPKPPPPIDRADLAGWYPAATAPQAVAGATVEKKSSEQAPAQEAAKDPVRAAPPGAGDYAQDSTRRRPARADAASAPVPQQTTGYRVTQVRSYRAAGRDCRRYTLEATIAGTPRRIYGTACRQPDGSWGDVQYPEAFYRTVMP